MSQRSIEVEPPQDQVIRGTIRRVTFHNPENGYSVIQLTTSGRGEAITVVGCCLRASVGTEIVARGNFREHPRYGKQLSATSITETTPSSAEGIEKYLASGFVKGIGAKTARRLVEEFGEETLEIIYKDPERVAKMQGIGRHKVALLRASLAEHRELQEIMRFLLEHHVTQGLAARIYERYQNRAIEVIGKDPYVLARDLRGVGFATADTIAMNLGLKPDSPQRLKAGLYYALEKATEDGHCYLTEDQLLMKAQHLLGLADQDGTMLLPHLEVLIEEDYLVRSAEAIYLKHMHRAEEFIASFVAERCVPCEFPSIPPEVVKASLARAQKELGISFSVEQQEAVRMACEQRLLIITGGPGCGKTTIIRALSLMYREAGKRLSMAAPTGRAAQRMAQVCEMNASTIHRLLRYDPVTHHFVHGINDPLPIDALIIDEASMIDLLLARDLLSAIPKNATLILVGDKDQLPSVGPGRVFADLIALSEVQTIALSRLFRRAEESAITSIAHQMNSGIIPEIPTPDGVTKTDAYFIPRKDPQEAAAMIEKLVSDQIPKKFGFSLNEITVLTPSNRGELGAERLNQRIQEKVNPAGSLDIEQEIANNSSTLRVKDRVCQRVNNYQIDENGVFNGDVGDIYSVDKRTNSLVVEMWDGRLVKYTGSDLSQLSLAYAVTVHRSQGSEIPCVVLALHDSHYTLLDRQLIYTAVTRAKKLLVIVGSKRALAIAVKRTNTKRRNSLLSNRIRDLLGA